MRLDQIPLFELKEDRASSEMDTILCQFALMHGRTQYRGGSIQERLEGNQEIIKIIDSELERRNALH